MGFLIKSAFWIGLILLVIPLDSGMPGGERASIGAFEAFIAVREAASDLGGICERKPEVCETGRAALQTIAVRAREGARIASEALDGFAEPDASELARDTATVPDATIATGSVPSGG